MVLFLRKTNFVYALTEPLFCYVAVQKRRLFVECLYLDKKVFDGSENINLLEQDSRPPIPQKVRHEIYGSL